MTEDTPQSASILNPNTGLEVGVAQWPSHPYRGIDYYRFVDHPIFFARQIQTLELLRAVVIYKGVILFGSSGAGKSSLINAGLLPKVIEMGFAPERIRVQNRPGFEIIIDRISLNDDEKAPFLSPSLADAVDKNGSKPLILSLDQFKVRLQTYAKEQQPLLIFDQFEETISLFEEIPHPQGSFKETIELQQRIIHALVALLHDDSLRIKMLFTFREDYLAKLTKLFLLAPELPNQFVRLTLPQKQLLEDIIAGPLKEELRKHYIRQQKFPRTLIDRLIEEFTLRSEGDDINLTEVQIVCVELWEAADPVAHFEKRGIRGLLEDYLTKELDEFPAHQKRLATGLLGHMLTVSNTRNFISGVELIRLFQQEEPTITTTDLENTLRALTPTRLVRREFRHGNFFYEIASEFLVPWIIEQKIARHREMERARVNRKLKFLYGGLALLGLILLLAVGLARRENILKDNALVAEAAAAEAQRKAVVKQEEIERIITTLSILFQSPPPSPSLDKLKRKEITDKLKNDKLAGIQNIGSLLGQNQFPVDEVPALIQPLTRDRDPAVAKAAQDLMAQKEHVKASQQVLKETADRDKLKAIEQMRKLIDDGNFSPLLVFSLLGPTLSDKNSSQEVTSAARNLLAYASAKNKELAAPIADAVKNDPTLASRVPPRVYIQIESQQQLDKANGIKTELVNKGYLVPDFEIVDFRAPRRNELRFYREADRENAEQIIEMLKTLPLDVELKYLKGYETSTKLRPGHYELWLAAQSKPSEKLYLVVRYYSGANEEQRAVFRNQISQIIEQEGVTMEELTTRELRIGPYSSEQVDSVIQRLIHFDPRLKQRIVILAH